MIQMKNIAKSYDGKHRVIENIDLEIKKGEFFILLGPSGCGKSTLLRMIAGLEKVTEGELWIDGQSANALLPKERNLSMVFQNYALFPHMTVRENILFGLDAQKVPKQEQEARLKQAADSMGLTEYLKRKPGQLSGGQRQRVALARSICSQMPICLMDEPLSNLDAKLRGQMRSEIRRIQKALGLTIVYVTHDQVEAMTMGDRIMVLNEGRVQQVGEPLEVYNDPNNLQVATFIGMPQMNVFDARAQEDGFVLNDTHTLQAVGQGTAPLRQYGEDLIVGIRAEHLKRETEDAAYLLEVTASMVEYTGDETQISFDTGKGFGVVKWPGQIAVKQGERLRLGVESEHLYFFRRSTGERLRPSGGESR